MACKTSFELHHNFPRIAEESGFTFNTHKPRVQINWSKIKLIDIENLIRDRKFTIVEHHINDILDCLLESEFDVRILDEGVIKIFRLAQLAVEYQQFCRHYLDRSVCLLREEVTNLAQDLDITKKSLKEKEEEIKKLKRKPKYSVRSLPYGNENIATMILRTLNQTRGELFSTTPQIDTLQYNKCNHCEKVFMNQLYLQSHISRRHANIFDIPQRDTADKEETNNEINDKLTSEVAELKSKLKQMEDLIAKLGDSNNKDTVIVNPQNNVLKESVNTNYSVIKEKKDAEVSTNEEGYIIDKIEAWKKEENEKYNNELSLLRKQIIDIVNNKEVHNHTQTQNEIKMMEQLHATIKEQGAEILSLKQEILKGENNEKEKRKEIEKQMEFWINRAEVQSNEYKSLLQKLNDVVKEAQEFRIQANTEKERASKLEELLQLHLKKVSPKHINTGKQTVAANSDELESVKEPKPAKNEQAKPTVDVITLKKLQQQAQELLNIGETSSSDISSINVVKKDTILRRKEQGNNEDKLKRNEPRPKDELTLSKSNISLHTSDKAQRRESKKTNKKQKNKTKSVTNKTSKGGNGYVYIPGSPLKIVRAKLTEEVNQRLISLGVDPLKNRVPRVIFQKQRKYLQEQQEYKLKKYPSREKIVLSIMSQLDRDTSNTVNVHKNDYISPKKSPKTFSISSVLSNVKTKALSLVKYDESNNKRDKNYDDVTKRALALLQTPPGSTHSSPKVQRRSSLKSPDKIKNVTSKPKKKLKNKPYQIKNKEKRKESNEMNNSSKESDSEFDNTQNHKQIKKYINARVMSPKREPVIDKVDSPNSPDSRNIFPVNEKSNPNLQLVNGSKLVKNSFFENKDSSDDMASSVDISPRKFLSEESLDNPKLTKGVLKNASSTLSLNKKKVLFDMDAIQMKSVSASPSQSITEKNDENIKARTVKNTNLVTEEWDISSIENEPAQSTTTKIQISAHTSPKIAELKQTIESQLSRRNPTLSTALVGGVDVLAAPIQKGTSFGGSNTSLGSSILDDTDSAPVPNHKPFLKPKTTHVKDDSEIEISDLINDELGIKKY